MRDGDPAGHEMVHLAASARAYGLDSKDAVQDLTEVTLGTSQSP
jgi:hypothetical protein